MIYSLLSGSPPTTPRPSRNTASGTATIVIRGDQVLLDTGSEALPVDQNILKMFSPSEEVHYEIRGTVISLSPITTPEQPVQGSLPDAAVFTPDKNTLQKPTVADVQVFPPLHKTPGLYAFTTCQSALSFLQQSGNTEVAAPIEDIINADKIVLVFIKEAADGSMTAEIHPLEDALPLLGITGSLLKSDVFRKMPAEQLLSLLSTCGSLPTSELIDIDKQLIHAGIHIPSIRAGSATVQEEMLFQWLQTSLGSSLTPAQCAELIPVKPAQQIVAMMQAISSELPSEVKDLLPHPDTFTLTSPQQERAPSREMLQKPFSALGFDLESLLASAAPPRSPDKVHSSLKSLLLNLISRFGAAAEAQNIVQGNPAMQPSESTVSADSAPGRPAIALHKLHLQELHRAIALSVVNINSLHAILTPNADAADGTISYTAPPHVNGGSSVPPLSRILQNSAEIEQIITRAEQISRSDQAILLQEEQLPVSGNHQSGQRSISSISTALTQELGILASPGAPFSSIPENSTFTSFDPEVAKTLVRIQKLLMLLDTALSTLDNETSDHLRSPSLTKNTIEAPESSKGETASHTSTDPGFSGDKSASLSVQLKNMLTTIESLQVLAKPVATEDGTRQIITLPVKFGNEFTEVVIQLNDQRKQEKRNQTTAHFAVDINISPPRLGPIRTHLDYSPSKTLHITMTFERKATLTWFKEQVPLLQKELKNRIATPATITFTTAKKQPASEKTTVSGINSIIDMKV